MRSAHLPPMWGQGSIMLDLLFDGGVFCFVESVTKCVCRGWMGRDRLKKLLIYTEFRNVLDRNN